MKLISFFTSAAIIGACALNTNTANAQGTPSIGNDRLTGNQTSRSFFIEAGNGIVANPYIQFVNNSSSDLMSASSIGLKTQTLQTFRRICPVNRGFL